MNSTLLLLLFCLIAIIYTFYRFFKTPFFHNVVLSYIAILLTFYCVTPTGIDWFYLFQFDTLFDTINLPIFNKNHEVLPITQDNVITEQVKILSEQLDLLTKQQMETNRFLKALLKQNLDIFNNTLDNLAVVTNQIANLKESLKAIQNSVDLSTKTLNNTLIANTKEVLDTLVYNSNISVKTLESMYSLNNQFLVSSNELSKINSILDANKSITSDGFTALHKALQTGSEAQSALQNKIDLINQKIADDRYKNYTEFNKLRKEYETHYANITAEVEQIKPKSSTIDAKITSSWFNGWFSTKPQN